MTKQKKRRLKPEERPARIPTTRTTIDKKTKAKTRARQKQALHQELRG